MTGFRLTNQAKADLKAIGRYTEATWGRQQRNRYLTVLDQAFHALADDHSKGRDCSAIRSGYRKYPVGKHIVFYREINAGLIEVVRVLHGRMDVDSHL